MWSRRFSIFSCSDVQQTKHEERRPPLRIMYMLMLLLGHCQTHLGPRFLKDTQLEQEATRLGASVNNRQVCLEYDTIDYLINTLGVSPVFMSTITTVPWLLSTGNAFFKTRTPQQYDGLDSLCSARE